MEIRIKETGKIEILSIIDPITGVNYIRDFIGNSGAFIDESQFAWDDEGEVYVCGQDTYDWWSKVASDNEELENKIRELKQEHDATIVESIVYGAGNVDLENHADCVNAALDEHFGG